MENNILMENQPINEAPKRPQFITVLCILSFVGCGLAFIGAIWGYFSIKASAVVLENMGSAEGDAFGMMSGMQETMLKAVENAVPNLIIGLVCSLLCLYGALQMWKLKKVGFFVYCVGEITPAIAGFFLGGGGLIGGTGAVIGLLFAMVWIVLYAVNLKHMTN
ncbi:MAG: hypothetical protein HY062_16665 [Bacteroidetes bacterium]|nr:hypothetical protein [Bacteroidota bacterium]